MTSKTQPQRRRAPSSQTPDMRTAKQSLNYENKEKAKKLLQELIIVSDTDLL